MAAESNGNKRMILQTCKQRIADIAEEAVVLPRGADVSDIHTKRRTKRMLTIWEIVVGGPAAFFFFLILYGSLFGAIYLVCEIVPQKLFSKKAKE